MGGTAKVSVQEVAEKAVAGSTTNEEWTLLMQSPL
jgi:hypothetical protein